MMEDGPGRGEKPGTLLANLDVSIAALTPVAAGDEDINQILQAK